MGEDRNVGVHLVQGAAGPPAVPPRRKLSASLRAARLTSRAIRWPEPLTLPELGQTGALNSSQHRALSGWRAPRATDCLHYAGSGYLKEDSVGILSPVNQGRAEGSPRRV